MGAHSMTPITLTRTAEGREWNPRYLAYCRATGAAGPQEVLDRDRAEHPGAGMVYFMIWISRELREFRAVNPGTPRDHLDHKAFDAWLESRYPSPVADDGQLDLFQEAAP